MAKLSMVAMVLFAATTASGETPRVLSLAASEPFPLGAAGAVAPVLFHVGEHSSESQFKAATPELLGGIRAWQIQILDAAGKKLGYVQGRGIPPTGAIPWFGLAPTGEVLQDGLYFARLVWIDKNKHVQQSEATVFGLETSALGDAIGIRWPIPEEATASASDATRRG